MRIIRNVVFDIGRVLLEYEPFDYLSKHYEPGKAKELMELVYGSPEWLDADRGIGDFDSLYKIFRGKKPEWAGDFKRLLSRESMLQILTPKQECVDFMRELKAAGYKIYLLSNFSTSGFGWMDEAYPFLSEADGRVISSHVKLIKPDPEIYRALLSMYALDPAETVFIDDAPANVRAAAGLGIHAIRFTGIEQLRDEFGRLIHA